MSAQEHISFLKCLIHEKECDKTPSTELEALPLEDEAEYLKVYRVIQVNQFIVTKAHFMWGDPYSKSAMYIYPKASHMSHSCVPNSSWSIGPTPEYKLRIRTAVLVKKGERLTVSRFIQHGSHCATTSHRQASLTEQGIVCKCDRCTDPTEMGLYYSATECPSCRKNKEISKTNNSGYLLPLSPLLGKTTSWKCNNSNCSYTMDATQHQKMIDWMTFRSNEEAGLDVPPANQLGSGSALSKDLIYWDKLGNAAEKLGETFSLHRNHRLTHTSIKTSVANACNADYMKDASLEIIQRRLRRLSYCLAIEDIISPGLSVERARLCTVILKLLSHLLLSMPWVMLHTPTEIRDYHKLFKHCCADSLKYFKGEFHAPGETVNEQAKMISEIQTAVESVKLPWLQ